MWRRVSDLFSQTRCEGTNQYGKSDDGEPRDTKDGERRPQPIRTVLRDVQVGIGGVEVERFVGHLGKLGGGGWGSTVGSCRSLTKHAGLRGYEHC